jgi:hypothetical protein
MSCPAIWEGQRLGALDQRRYIVKTKTGWAMLRHQPALEKG